MDRTNLYEQIRQLIPGLTDLQIAQALDKWSKSILPFPESFPVFTLGAAATPLSQSIQVDGSYALIIKYISLIETGNNVDSLINTFNINNTTYLIGSNPLPTGMITQYTGFPVEWPGFAPANSSITIQVQSGSAGACNIYITLWCLRIPIDVIDEIKQEYGIR